MVVCMGYDRTDTKKFTRGSRKKKNIYDYANVVARPITVSQSWHSRDFLSYQNLFWTPNAVLQSLRTWTNDCVRTYCMLTFKESLSYGKKRLKLNQSPPRHGLTHFASCDFTALYCIIYCDTTPKNSFRARRKLCTTSTIFILPSFLGTKYARYLRISNNLICLRGFPAVFSLLLPADPLPLCTAHAFQAF
jgi:hypothetical protein